MADSQTLFNPRLWINYPYINSEERDFSYLVPQLKKANIEAAYDSFQLISDVHLWERIMPRLISIGFDGWLYILTHQCFTRKAFTDELTAAIDKVTQRLGPKFPMIGLMHGIATQNVPTALRVRPCISLGDPEWKQQLSETLRNRVSPGKERTMREETRFSWKIHSCYGGDPSMTAVEVRSMAERIQYWRFAVPKSTQTARWGRDPPEAATSPAFGLRKPKDRGNLNTGTSCGLEPPTPYPTRKAPMPYFSDRCLISYASGRKEPLWPSRFNGGHASQESGRAIARVVDLLVTRTDASPSGQIQPASSNPQVKRHTPSQTAISAGEE